MRLNLGYGGGDMVGLQSELSGRTQRVLHARPLLRHHSFERDAIAQITAEKPKCREDLQGSGSCRQPFDQECGNYSVIGFSEPVRRILGKDAPGLMRARRYKFDGEVASVTKVGTICVQVDVAYEVHREFPSAYETVTNEAACKALAGAYPALVVMNQNPSRLAKYGKVSSVEFHLETSPLETADLSDDIDVHVSVYRRDAQIWDISSVLVRPVNALAWAAARLQKESHALKVGDFITAGTFPLMLDIEPGDYLIVGFVTHAQVRTYRWRVE